MNHVDLARERERLLLEFLTDRARASLPCPTVEELSVMLGMGGKGGAARLMHRLADAGQLEIESTGARCIIHIPELGICTAHPRLFRKDGQVKRPIADFVALAARVSALPAEAVAGRKRDRLHLRPRFLAVLFAAQEGWSLAEIGRVIGRDHSTISYVMQQVQRWLKSDPLLRRMHRRMAAELAGEPEPRLVLPPRRPRPRPLPLAPRLGVNEYTPRHALPLTPAMLEMEAA